MIMRKGLIVMLLACLVFVGCDNFKGPAGDIGPKGDSGATGPQGPQGLKGADGTSITIARYDGTVTSNTIYVYNSGITANTVAEVYLGLTGFDNWMPVACSGVVWYYIDVPNKRICIMQALWGGWNKYRVFIY